MIRFEGLRKDYGNLVAVNNLNLEIGAGECFGFLGPNGAGKTTTIKMLAGLLVPTEGKVFIGGHDVQREPEKAKSILGYVPDKPYIHDKLTGSEFLDFMIDLYSVDRASAAAHRHEMLSIFGLNEWQDELVENYSHGMKQKLVITGAFIHRPKVLVIDEPMVGLDPHGHKLVKDIFRAFAREGNTIFMSTHTLAVAQELCHRIAIIDKGEVIALGTVEELRNKAHSESALLENIFLKLTATA
ncbi:MAG: ABC transporter ATP-binding protein [Nitrospinae bacterium]|nr:ABC transporter ATP-binding protein [Nitrospinota bacterium]